MNKTDKNDTEEENSRLVARISDAYKAAEARRGMRFIGFLDLREKRVAQDALTSLGADDYEFFGGYDGAERTMLCLYPPHRRPEHDKYPLAALEFTWRFGDLSHRDFLGALMSLGLRSEKIGDINVGGSDGTVVLDGAMADFVTQNLTRVGRCTVKCSAIRPDGIVPARSFKDICDTVASPRLDCIVSALTNISRGKSDELIRGGAVMVDFGPESDPDARMDDGATVSVRGHGRYIVDTVGPVTKKGRMRLTARKYI